MTTAPPRGGLRKADRSDMTMTTLAPTGQRGKPPAGAMQAQRVRRRARVAVLARRRVVPGQLEPPVAVWGAHHRDVRSDSLEPEEAIHGAAFEGRLAFQFQTE